MKTSEYKTFCTMLLLKRMERLEMQKKGQKVRTWARHVTITSQLIGSSILVHNGRTHVPVYITEQMVGYKLGEFSHTRTFRGHAKNKQQKDE